MKNNIMYKEIEIVSTDFENKYLVRLYDKSMHVGFMVKDIIEFLKEGKKSDEMQKHFKERYELFVEKQLIDDVIENKINPFVVKQADTSFVKIATLFNPSVIPVPKIVLEVFSKYFFYFMGLFFFSVNAYFYFESMQYQTNSISEKILGYVLLFLILLGHEMGHSLAAKRYDTNVKEIGLGWYLIFPVFYVDLNEIWKLSSYKRIIINLAGIYLQLFCGVLLLLSSFFIEELKGMFMMVFFMNFSVVILNVNPFLKFDGYWIVSDLLEGKDLYAVSGRIVKKWMRFEKSGEENVMIVYTVLRTVFILFILFTFLQVFYRSVYSLVTNGKMESSGVFIVVFLMLLFYRILKKRKSKKNERLA